MHTVTDLQFLRTLCDIAQKAGRAAMAHYDAPGATDKSDGSPVTLADLAADAVIEDGLKGAFAHIPRVSEEGASSLSPQALQREEFFLIDPLDGTKEFIKRNGEFTVNIALVRNCEQVAGVVHAPATGETWMGALGVGAWKLDLNEAIDSDTLRPLLAAGVGDSEGMVVLGSRSHANDAAMAAFLKDKRVARFVAAGSSLKFCRIAEGAADVYPRFGPTMEWDTAAGHAVLAAAGGSVTLLDGTPLLYAKAEYRNPDFVAASRAAAGR